MKFMLVTNRRLDKSNPNDHTLFGEKVNENGPAEVRLAWVEKVGHKWQLELIEEPDDLSINELPSREVFRKYKKTLTDEDKSCLFYIHGYNKKFKETLQQGWDLQKRYGLGVVLFSWASNPGGFPLWEYPKAAAIARASSPALDLTLEKLGRYMCDEQDDDCNISINLLVHSLGAYVFQSYVEKPLFSNETRIFDNLILHQADVDSLGHKYWLNKLKYSRRIYATINEKDKILDISDVVNPDRLGNTAKNLNADRAIYMDFTHATKIKKTHQLFGKYTSKNPIAKAFFLKVLNGNEGEFVSGIRFDSRKNVYEVG